jgi:hypothetical protein
MGELLDIAQLLKAGLWYERKLFRASGGFASHLETIVINAKREKGVKSCDLSIPTFCDGRRFSLFSCF